MGSRKSGSNLGAKGSSQWSSRVKEQANWKQKAKGSLGTITKGKRKNLCKTIEKMKKLDMTNWVKYIGKNKAI